MIRQPWLEAEHEERELIEAEDRAYFQKSVHEQWEKNQIKKNGRTKMKRSEAINIIAGFIYELNVEPEDCEEESNLILNALEEAGMMSPTVELLAGGERMLTKELLDYSEIDYESNWEPEDEEK